MATYKQACIRCGAMLERSAHFCSTCGSNAPFGDACPGCHAPITREQQLCSGCGRQLYVACPHCKQRTYVGGATCDACGLSLMLYCGNKRCGHAQFFQNKKCTDCGKKIRKQDYDIFIQQGVADKLKGQQS
ncbi:MAG: zinc ribbon domain-containing protein [Actinomycetes bacterium]|jgi:predicted amidophosphoribosyltransferase|nr:zinc ribbon domain-containing protein [Actinomycetes bacterium]